MYEEVKVYCPDMAIARVFASKQMLTLEDHVKRLGLDGLSTGQQVDAMSNVLFTVSVSGTESELRKPAVLKALGKMTKDLCLFHRSKLGPPNEMR
jgi:hypothetical protein